ncbi:GTPase Era [Alphaproteobacteria bacterium]|nr:GTPase Era [Alphaproteobacteria bacterium]
MNNNNQQDLTNNKSGNKKNILNKKHGIIAIVGMPNAGKSSLCNAMLQQKISIVSPKVQTTRNSIKAIITLDNCQIIGIDTPGIFIPRQDKILERIIVKTAWQALREADHIAYVIDSEIGVNLENQRILNDLKKENLPITIIINKIDKIRKSKILTIIADLANLGFLDIIPVSALTNEGIDLLTQFLKEKCLRQDWPYPEEEITDASMRFIASEITREKLFLNLNQELPYSISVKTDSFEILDNHQLKIKQTILVLKESQKSIVLGKNGQMIKKIGEQARHDIGQIANTKVHLFLFVKVEENWMNKTENFDKFELNKLPQNKN